MSRDTVTTGQDRPAEGPPATETGEENPQEQPRAQPQASPGGDAPEDQQTPGPGPGPGQDQAETGSDAKATDAAARAENHGDDPPAMEDEAMSESSDNGADEAPTVAQLQAALGQAQKQAAEHWDLVLRTRAELDNAKKRALRDLEQARKFGLERFVDALLPVVDSMELGVAASEADEADIHSVREGLVLTHKMFVQAAEKFGVTEVDPLGEAFNPERHQAMSMQESPQAQPGTVLVVVQKGYLLNERLVRPAMVIVAK